MQGVEGTARGAESTGKVTINRQAQTKPENQSMGQQSPQLSKTTRENKGWGSEPGQSLNGAPAALGTAWAEASAVAGQGHDGC